MLSLRVWLPHFCERFDDSSSGWATGRKGCYHYRRPSSTIYPIPVTLAHSTPVNKLNHNVTTSDLPQLLFIQLCTERKEGREKEKAKESERVQARGQVVSAHRHVLPALLLFFTHLSSALQPLCLICFLLLCSKFPPSFPSPLLIILSLTTLSCSQATGGLLKSSNTIVHLAYCAMST